MHGVYVDAEIVARQHAQHRGLGAGVACGIFENIFQRRCIEAAAGVKSYVMTLNLVVLSRPLFEGGNSDNSCAQ